MTIADAPPPPLQIPAPPYFALFAFNTFINVTIILDNKLPDGFGVDFITYVKKSYPGIKIIMISGFSTARDVALENGADVFLEKPFSMDNVNQAIDHVLARS